MCHLLGKQALAILIHPRQSGGRWKVNVITKHKLSYSERKGAGLTAPPLFQVSRSGWGAGRLRMWGRKGAALFSKASLLGFAAELLSLLQASTH